MSTRTNWSRVANETPEIVDEWTDCYGQELDPGGIALVLGVDCEVTVFEAVDVDDVRDFAHRILAACDRFEDLQR